MSDKNTCAYCDEPMDEYIDCMESDDGKHHSVYNVNRAMKRMRARETHEMENRPR